MGSRKTGRRDSAGPVVMQLSALEVMTLNRHDAEARAANAELTALQMQRTMLLARLDHGGHLARLDAALQQKKTELMEAHGAYKESSDVVGMRLGVNLKNYAFDDKTGALHLMSTEFT